MYIRTAAGPRQEHTRCPLEFWVDIPNGRKRARKASISSNDKGTKVILTESVSDGQFSMAINHTDRSVKFSRLNPFWKRLLAHTTFDQMLKQWFGDPEHLEGFAKIEQERIGPDTFDVWQGETDIHLSANIKMRIKCWIAPSSGEIGKLKYWMHYPDASETWSLVLDIETIERNVPVPPGTFTVDPPEGYTLKNTKENAPVSELNMAGGLGLDGLKLSKNIEFSLEDGSVLIGWNSIDSQAQGGQEALFSDLEFGGALPKLPIEIYGLKTMQAGTAVTLVGYHLAHTKKKGRFYEWSLYVADRPVPKRKGFVGYEALTRFNPADRKVNARGRIGVTNDIRIRNSNDFDALVRGAMAELSDDGKVPDHVTYENVKQLIKKVKEEGDGK